MHKKICNFLIRLIQALSVAIILFFSILYLSGHRLFILRSGSMAPQYPAGSLVCADIKTTADDVSINDVLVYRTESGLLIMHRLIGLEDRPCPDRKIRRYAIMRGDKNKTTECIDLSSQLVGKITT